MENKRKELKQYKIIIRCMSRPIAVSGTFGSSKFHWIEQKQGIIAKNELEDKHMIQIKALLLLLANQDSD